MDVHKLKKTAKKKRTVRVQILKGERTYWWRCTVSAAFINHTKEYKTLAQAKRSAKKYFKNWMAKDIELEFIGAKK